MLRALNRPGVALARQREALASFEALAAADPANAAAKNDLAISLSKVAEMLDARGERAEAVGNYQRALEIHQELAANDPANDSMKLEVASDYNRLATAQAKAGARQGLENHTRAVDMVRELQEKNPANVELQVALGLALASRGDAHALWARSQSRRSTRLADLHAAERDDAESVAIFTALQRAGSIEGTDRQTLENNRKALEEVRADRSR